MEAHRAIVSISAEVTVGVDVAASVGLKASKREAAVTASAST